jgi:hypothetical protein
VAQEGAKSAKSPSSKKQRGSVTHPKGVVEEEGSSDPKKQRTPVSRRRSVTLSRGAAEEEGSSDPKKQRTPVSRVREAPNRSTMTMQDLIYYNPTANPMRY